MPRAKVSSGAEYLNTALCAAHAQGTLAAAASSTPAERCGPRFATPSALYSDMLRLVLLEATARVGELCARSGGDRQQLTLLGYVPAKERSAARLGALRFRRESLRDPSAWRAGGVFELRCAACTLLGVVDGRSAGDPHELTLEVLSLAVGDEVIDVLDP